MQLRALEPRARRADRLDADPEKPQTGANGMSPRVNAEFVEGAGIVIDEFEYCVARLSAMRPRDPSDRDNLVTCIPGRVNHQPNPRKARQRRQQAQSKMCSESASRQQDVGTENEMRVGDREIVLVIERRPFRHA